MKKIKSSVIEDVCYKLLTHASIELPPEVEKAIQEAYQKESNPTGKFYFKAMLDNINISRERRVPLCQDTGIPMFYINLGSEVYIQGSLREAVDRATSRATQDVPLREQVSHPLTREISKTNVGWGIPPIFLDYKDNQDYIEIIGVPRGGGAEAKWQCVHPYAGVDRKKAIMKIALDAMSMAGGECCPPVIMGIGVGGYGRDYTEVMARKAMYRTPLNSRHSDPQVAELEETIYQQINKMGIGPLGIGGDTTCLAVHMNIAGGHTAGASVAVSLYCWSARYSKAKIMSDSRVEYITHSNIE
jgi:tartrate/fumarate subfamily iron-sulfur-dependent hydro-lyase alpha chain